MCSDKKAQVQPVYGVRQGYPQMPLPIPLPPNQPPRPALESARSLNAVDPHAETWKAGPIALEESADAGDKVGTSHRVEPPIPCPKCGGTNWTGSRYYDPSVPGVMEIRAPFILRAVGLWYTCLICGWERMEPTKDTSPPRVPPSPRMVPVPAFDNEPPSGFPPLRILRDGDYPCRICASGPGDHAHRDHAYQRYQSHTEPSWLSWSWWLTLIVFAALGWFLFIVQTIRLTGS